MKETEKKKWNRNLSCTRNAHRTVKNHWTLSSARRDWIKKKNRPESTKDKEKPSQQTNAHTQKLPYTYNGNDKWCIHTAWQKCIAHRKSSWNWASASDESKWIKMEEMWKFTIK